MLYVAHVLEQAQRHVVRLVDERVRRHAGLAHDLRNGQHDQFAKPTSSVVRLDDQRAQTAVTAAHGPRQQFAVVPAEYAQTDVQPNCIPKIGLGVHVAVGP